MYVLRIDLERLYRQRTELASGRWQFDVASFAEAQREINAKIRGLEHLICTLSRENLASIFRQEESGPE